VERHGGLSRRAGQLSKAGGVEAPDFTPCNSHVSHQAICKQEGIRQNALVSGVIEVERVIGMNGASGAGQVLEKKHGQTTIYVMSTLTAGSCLISLAAKLCTTRTPGKEGTTKVTAGRRIKTLAKGAIGQLQTRLR